MEISYQSVNPQESDSSFLFRFTTPDNETTTILTDPGPGADATQLLNNGSAPDFILLTHLHNDHYAELLSNTGENTTIYTSQPNKTILESVLLNLPQLTARNSLLHPDENHSIDIMALNNWTELTDSIHIRPVPVGHAFGATGFIIRCILSNRMMHLFIAADASSQHVAGMHGIPSQLPVQPDVFVVNSAKDKGDTETPLPDLLKRTLEQVNQQYCVQIATSSLNTVQFAALLSPFTAALSSFTEIKVFNLAAHVLEAIDVEYPNVTTHPNIDNPSTEVAGGKVLISGPGDLQHGTAKTLHQTLSENGMGPTYQVISPASHYPSPKYRENVSTFSYAPHMHFTDLEALIKSYAPIHVILGHSGNKELSENITDSVVWASDRDQSPRQLRNRTLGWTGPHWLPTSTVDGIISQAENTVGQAYSPSTSFPPITPQPISYHDEAIPKQTIESAIPGETLPDWEDPYSIFCPENSSSQPQQIARQTDNSDSGTEGNAKTSTQQQQLSLRAVELHDDLIVLYPHEQDELTVSHGDVLTAFVKEHSKDQTSTND